MGAHGLECGGQVPESRRSPRGDPQPRRRRRQAIGQAREDELHPLDQRGDEAGHDGERHAGRRLESGRVVQGDRRRDRRRVRDRRRDLHRRKRGEGIFRRRGQGCLGPRRDPLETRAILGDSSGAVEAWADKTSQEFGLVRKDLLDTAAGFGGLGKGLGALKGDQLSQFSTQFTQLAADLSSFANVDLTESAQALTIGLSGEVSDTLKRMGVIVNETTVKQYALAHGIGDANGKLSEQEKFTARAGLITEKLSDASGDLARTSGSAANQFRKAGGGVTNFATKIGELLLPAVMSGVGAFNELLASGIEVFESNLPLIQSWASTLTSGVEAVGAVVRNAGSYWTIFKLSAQESIENTIAWIATLPENLSIIGNYVANNWTKLITDGINAVGAAFHNFGTYLGELAYAAFEWLQNPLGEFKAPNWKPLLDGFKATADQLPEFIKPPLVSMQKEIGDELDKIRERETRRSEDMAKKAAASSIAAKKPEEEVAPEGGERKFASIAEEGSKEAYSAILKFQTRNNREDSETKRIARNSDTQVKTLDRIAKAVEAKPASGGVPVYSFGG